MRLIALLLIILFLCAIPFEDSSAERRRTTQIKVLQDGAYNNKSPRLQFELGLAYYQGNLIPRDYADAYIWFAIAASQGVEGATAAAEDVAEILKHLGIFKYVERKAQLYYKKYVSSPQKGQSPQDVFTVYVNGLPYQYVAAITPEIPIEISFSHPDPTVSKIRIQNPDNPGKFVDFKIGQTPRVTYHEQHMEEGVPSSSTFIAFDENGKKKGTIIISFVPP